MNTCVYRVLEARRFKSGVVLELKANQQYFTPELRKGEQIEINDFDGHLIKTRVKAIVQLDDPHPDSDVAILLPKDIRRDLISPESEVWKSIDQT